MISRKYLRISLRAKDLIEQGYHRIEQTNALRESLGCNTFEIDKSHEYAITIENDTNRMTKSRSLKSAFNSNCSCLVE